MNEQYNMNVCMRDREKYSIKMRFNMLADKKFRKFQ